jgi:hypothetical protein
MVHVLLWVVLAQAAGPWVLMSAITRLLCQGAACGPIRSQPAPQRHRVQSFRTAEACLKVREQLMQRVDEATAPVNALVEARTPAWSIQTRTMFVCEPDTETTEEQ